MRFLHPSLLYFVVLQCLVSPSQGGMMNPAKSGGCGWADERGQSTYLSSPTNPSRYTIAEAMKSCSVDPSCFGVQCPTPAYYGYANMVGCYFMQEQPAIVTADEAWQRVHVCSTKIIATTTAMPTTTPTAMPTTTTAMPTFSLCNSYVCGEDAGFKPAINNEVGQSFEECCECTFAAKNHVFLGTYMEGNLNEQTRYLSLSFDLPSDITISSITWNGAHDQSLSLLEGHWNTNSVNQCRKQYEITDSVQSIFGDGSEFTLSGTTLTASIQIEASAQVDEGSAFERTYTEDVPVLIGLETETTIEVTFHMKTQDLEEEVHITGNAEHVATDGSVLLTMKVTTPGCIQNSASVVQGMEHITQQSFSFSNSTLVNNLCEQDVKFRFNAVQVFTDTLGIQFITRQGEAFVVNIDVNIRAQSILDYLPFDATMSFHAESTYQDEPQTDFLLGSEVYTLINVSPLIALPLSSIDIVSFTLKQTDYSGNPHTTDLMGEKWANFQVNSLPADNKVTVEFELESTHFHVSADGELCEVRAEVEISYQDGVTIRRTLATRRRLSTQDTANSIRIVDSFEEAMVSLGTYEFSKANLSCLILVGAAVLWVLHFTFSTIKRQQEASVYSRLLSMEEI